MFNHFFIFLFIFKEPRFLDFKIEGSGVWEDKVIVTCGHPPFDLFGTDWRPEWRRDGNVIVADGVHTISKNNSHSVLSVSQFIRADSGKKQTTAFHGEIHKSYTFKMRVQSQHSLVIQQVQLQHSDWLKGKTCLVQKKTSHVSFIITLLRGLSTQFKIWYIV